MKTLAEQHAIMAKQVKLAERCHRMTKAKRKEFERLTARALKRATQIERRQPNGI